jgi:hypothetical protein
MKRAICILLVLACVGSAFAAAVKIKEFTVVNEPAGAAAMAMMNYTGGPNAKTVVQVTVTGFTPNTTYDIVLDGGAWGWMIVPGVLQTDENGDGHAHWTVPVNVSDSTVVQIGFAGTPGTQEFDAHATGSPQ